MTVDSVLIAAVAGLVSTASGLLAWLTHRNFQFFSKFTTEMSDYTKQLVAQNQTNVEHFLVAVNHQQTMNREAQDRSAQAIEKLSVAMDTNNKTNEAIIRLLGEKM
jgi:hypothetical protein